MLPKIKYTENYYGDKNPTCRLEDYPFYTYIIDVLDELCETGDYIISHTELHPYVEKKIKEILDLSDKLVPLNIIFIGIIHMHKIISIIYNFKITNLIHHIIYFPDIQYKQILQNF